MGCQQWQPFAYTRTEAIQTLLVPDGNLSTEYRKQRWHGFTGL
nr:MAG TPA: hypothetical protein [Caudoviricetes sp.]